MFVLIFNTHTRVYFLFVNLSSCYDVEGIIQLHTLTPASQTLKLRKVVRQVLNGDL